MNTALNKLCKYCLALISILFLIYFTILSINSRPHFDDLNFISTFANGTSIIDYVSEYYYSESGAFASFFINGLLFNKFNNFELYKYYPILFILLGSIICCYSFKLLIKGTKIRDIVLFTLVFYSIYIFTIIDQTVPYWLCAMGYCLKGPELLLLFSLLVCEKKTILDKILIFILVIKLGGGNIAFACIALACFCLFFVIKIAICKFSLSEVLKDKRARIFLAAFIVFIIAFSINISAPGYYRRLNGGEIDLATRPSGIISFLKCSVSCIVTFIYFNIFNLPYLLTTMAIACYFRGSSGICISDGKKIAVVSTILYIVILICYSWPSAFIFGSFGYQRPWSGMCFITYLYAATIGFCIPPFNKAGQRSVSGIITLACCIFTISAISLHLINDTASSREYAKEYDARMTLLSTVPKDYEGEIVLKPLTQPYTTDMKYVIRHIIDNSYGIKPELYIIPDNAKSHSEDAFRNYFGLSSKLNISDDILAVFHYLSLHSSPYYRDKHDGRELRQCDRYADCLVRLPLFFDLSNDIVLDICKLIQHE